ncbi:MAG: hypothetical protein JXB46_08835 [Candidatus Eisenbacteria bacterium]|nr:hypothetical protein [Candidatus Eisenbacteria bacterium]
MSEQSIGSVSAATEQELQQLRARVAQLEARVGSLPNTMILSRSFLARAFAVLGHYLVAGLMIALPIYALMFFFVIIVGCLN